VSKNFIIPRSLVERNVKRPSYQDTFLSSLEFLKKGGSTMETFTLELADFCLDCPECPYLYICKPDNPSSKRDPFQNNEID